MVAANVFAKFEHIHLLRLRQIDFDHPLTLSVDCLPTGRTRMADCKIVRKSLIKVTAESAQRLAINFRDQPPAIRR